ncbi:MAG: UvrD-helicase domain-containing protein [Nitrospinae bacterium]|nr:UvrD-helicase domain-containing protein [Nitrospinota bacterium]
MTPVLDDRERQKALDPAGSFIVQAPAGSGKTGLLIQRFLKLLARVEQPEQILAMTFTRKAAGEMRTRIMDALASPGTSATTRGPSPGEEPGGHEALTLELARNALERDRKKGWRILENPSRLKIQTIDSLCSALTQQMPVLSGTGGTLEIEENPRELYRETARGILSLAESGNSAGEAVRVILRHLDNSKSEFLSRTEQMLSRRDQWMIPFFDNLRLTENSRPYLENTLSGIIESVLVNLSRLLPERIFAQLIVFARYSGSALAEDDPRHPGACLNDLEGVPKPSADCLGQWKALANLLLTQKGEWRKKLDKNDGFPPDKTPEGKNMKGDCLDLMEKFAAIPGLREAWREIQRLPNPRYGEGEWGVLQAMLRLLPEMNNVLRGVFRERKRTDFTEISLSALTALGDEEDPTDLLLYLDVKIHHVLVDEYQDTSFKQRELLKRLTCGWTAGDGRSLFIVGDPMQSIYRFRDAEVGLFLDARDYGIGEVRLEPLQLKTNFRSQKKIVDWVNACFSRIFPKNDDSDLGSIGFAESAAFLPEEEFSGVCLHPAIDPRGVAEAGQIVDLIGEIRRDHPGSSIAILVRARSHLPEIVRQFRGRSVKFKAEEIDPLTSRPYILDLLALLRALLSPIDRVSWLSILRAPWCGLSLTDLHRLCANDINSPVWTLINDPERTRLLSEDGSKRLARFVSVMTETLNALPYANLRDLIEGCWTALGGPACVEESALKDADVFLEKVSKTLDEGDLESLQRFDRLLEDLYASPSVESEDAVHILTMHKAKGLEFDFVIIPGLGKGGKNEHKRLIYWMPHGANLLLAPIQETGGQESEVYNFLTHLDRKKEEFETLRLLYVSATRAKKQLHLFGHAPEKDGSAAPRANTLLAKLWPYVGPEWERLQKGEKEKARPEPEPLPAGNRIQRLPASFEPPARGPGIETGTAVELAGENEEKPAFEWAGNRARCLGNVLHRCFKQMADQGTESWTAERIDAMAPLLQSALSGEGLSPGPDVVRQAQKALKNILQDPVGRWILARHRDARSECPLTLLRENRYLNRAVDRTFVDENGIRWIVDYKTGEHQGTDLEGFFREEIDRYRPQLQQYEELLKTGGETQAIKKALYYPMHLRLVEIPPA